MKKSGQFFPLLAILMLLAACAGKSQASNDTVIPVEDTVTANLVEDSMGTDSVEDSAPSLEQRKALIPARVKEIYNADYFEKDKFLTAEYKRIRNLAESHADGDIIYDADPWTRSQDSPLNPKYSVGKISMSSPDKATVTIIESSEMWGTRECSELELVWVNNNWYVNDVGGTLEVYKDFLKENHKSY